MWCEKSLDRRAMSERESEWPRQPEKMIALSVPQLKQIIHVEVSTFVADRLEFETVLAEYEVRNLIGRIVQHAIDLSQEGLFDEKQGNR